MNYLRNRIRTLSRRDSSSSNSESPPDLVSTPFLSEHASTPPRTQGPEEGRQQGLHASTTPETQREAPPSISKIMFRSADWVLGMNEKTYQQQARFWEKSAWTNIPMAIALSIFSALLTDRPAEFDHVVTCHFDASVEKVDGYSLPEYLAHGKWDADVVPVCTPPEKPSTPKVENAVQPTKRGANFSSSMIVQTVDKAIGPHQTVDEAIRPHRLDIARALLPVEAPRESSYRDLVFTPSGEMHRDVIVGGIFLQLLSEQPLSVEKFKQFKLESPENLATLQDCREASLEERKSGLSFANSTRFFKEEVVDTSGTVVILTAVSEPEAAHYSHNLSRVFEWKENEPEIRGDLRYVRVFDREDVTKQIDGQRRQTKSSASKIQKLRSRRSRKQRPVQSVDAKNHHLLRTGGRGRKRLKKTKTRRSRTKRLIIANN